MAKGQDRIHSNGSRRRRAALGAETVGGGWRVAVAGNVQVVDDLRWERRWEADANERIL